MSFVSHANAAVAHGMRLVDVGDAVRARLVSIGWPVVPICTTLPEVTDRIMTPNYSGWPILTRKSRPEQTVYLLCQALEETGDHLVWDTDLPVMLAGLCSNTAAALFDDLLHPGAERYYCDRGHPPAI
ncbi:MAG TPA: hypothetical protein VNL18_01280 [Gemmatimonadales bacterium]|nr:hypothetical protein [Gemmatimonadales bacterium]